MPPTCPHCGGPECETRFHACLEQDYSDPGYGAVHHLVVGAYMLQHDAYADDVRAAMAEFVLAHLDRPPTAYTMRRIRAHTDGPARVRRRPDDPPPARAPADEAHGPRVTVADVDTTSAAAYRRTVRRWAEAVARDVAQDR
ncbi:DUF5946 family protein [Euzebya rosea]|uniref:DUF5946 family protein n=1 Tax=Euzebya rosea TaxID=2052804 RepID=UPI000D3E3F5A|nr:DUF5946 family protein [Euzebya rosea]